MQLNGKAVLRPLVLMMILFAMAACGKEAPAPKEMIRPVRFEQVFFRGGEQTRTFSGVAQAGQKIAMSFKVGGTVQRVAVKMGDAVKTGDLLAELDPRDATLEMEEAQAALRRQQADARNAAANYQRIEALYESNNASLSELDVARAQSETGRAAVASAQKSLELARRRARYTRLMAPVDGAIAEKAIFENENVQTGQTVLVISAGTQSEVLVTIPEVLITQIQAGDDVQVTFDAFPGKTFAAKVREVGISATGGAAFPVTVRLTSAKGDIRPGMAAEVAFIFGDPGDRSRILVPAKAIGEDIHGKYAFVVDPQGGGLGKARRVKVTTGTLTADGLEIFDGLADGDYLVTAGVHKLLNDQTVRFSKSEAGVK